MSFCIQTRLFLKATAGQPETPLSLQEVLVLCQGAEIQLINCEPEHLRGLESWATTGVCYNTGCCWQAELGHVTRFKKSVFGSVKSQKKKFPFSSLPNVGKLNSLSLICRQYDVGLLASDWLWRKPRYAEMSKIMHCGILSGICFCHGNYVLFWASLSCSCHNIHLFCDHT